MSEKYTIEMKGITKSFGKVVANKDINLGVKQGEILALLGENGSGKTTLMNMLSGIYRPDSGQIFVDGKEVETYATLGDTLMAFDITDAGEHTVEMKYMPKIYVIGGIVSAISVAAFVAVSVFECKKRKKKSAAAEASLTGGNE